MDSFAADCPILTTCLSQAKLSFQTVTLAITGHVVVVRLYRGFQTVR
jgi:hypothetical protein